MVTSKCGAYDALVAVVSTIVGTVGGVRVDKLLSNDFFSKILQEFVKNPLLRQMLQKGTAGSVQSAASTMTSNCAYGKKPLDGVGENAMVGFGLGAFAGAMEAKIKAKQFKREEVEKKVLEIFNEEEHAKRNSNDSEPLHDSHVMQKENQDRVKNLEIDELQKIVAEKLQKNAEDIRMNAATQTNTPIAQQTFEYKMSQLEARIQETKSNFQKHALKAGVKCYAFNKGRRNPLKSPEAILDASCRGETILMHDGEHRYVIHGQDYFSEMTIHANNFLSSCTTGLESLQAVPVIKDYLGNMMKTIFGDFIDSCISRPSNAQYWKKLSNSASWIQGTMSSFVSALAGGFGIALGKHGKKTLFKPHSNLRKLDHKLSKIVKPASTQ